MALAAEDSQIMYEEEKQYEATHGDIEATHNHQSNKSGRSGNSSAADTLPTAKDQINYQYLEWDTPPEDLCTNPRDLPLKVTTVIDPFQWSAAHKNAMLVICCCSTFVAAYTAGAYTSGLKQMEEEWGVGRVPLLVGVTTYATGFGVAPMFLAPLSEVYGRRIVFLASYILFNGVAGSTFSTICGGVISDLYRTESRGFPMACFTTMAIFGTGAGPLVSGFIADNMSWRWIHWVQLITGSTLVVGAQFFLKETRGSVLLIRRAKLLNAYLDSTVEATPVISEKMRYTRWKVRAEEERASLSYMVRISLTRPFFLLFTEPVVFFFSLWAAFSWGVLYLFLQGIPLVFQTSHDFTISQTGAVFTSMCVASLLALLLNTFVERGSSHFLPYATGPETRLYASCMLGSLLPIGMFWFGWTSFPSQHWILPTLAVGLATIGIFSIYLAVFNYFADTYHRYASSALAAQSFCRNMLGGFFPLVTDAMYHRMTFQGASSFLGAVGVVLSVVPWVLVMYGDRVRRRSKFAKEIMEG